MEKMFPIIGKTGTGAGSSAEAAEERAGALHLRGLDELTGGALFDDHAAVHEEDAVGDVAGEGHFVGHDDHRHLLGGEIADDRRRAADSGK